MNHRKAVGPTFRLLAVLVLGSAFGFGTAEAQAPDAAAHKQWMNDASDAQEDVRFAITDKDQQAAVAALNRLDSLMAKTADYWAAKQADAGVRLARTARDLAVQARTAAQAGALSDAVAPFEKMGATCNACHELHLEKP